MACEALLRTIDELNEVYLKVWADICNLESPTSSKAGVDAVGDYFIRMARQYSWQIEVLELENAGNAICITMNPDAPQAAVTFSGHIDTVHPVGLFGNPPVHRDESRIYGPGVTDCKGGVVASFLAMDALERCGFRARPVRLIIQSDEETGSRNSQKKTVEFMCEKAKGSAAFLNTEGIEGQTAVIARKGILRYRFHVHGVAAHSYLCYTGANAVAEAAHKILKLEQLKDPEGLTCNCGVIEGGTVPNAVAAECSFTADIRYPDMQTYEKAMQTMQEVAAQTTIEGCTCTIEKVSDRPAMPLVPENEALMDTMNRIYADCGLPQLSRMWGIGGSDAAYTTLAGIPTVDSIGVEGDFIHSVKEYAELRSLAESAKRLATVAWCI